MSWQLEDSHKQKDNLLSVYAKNSCLTFDTWLLDWWNDIFYQHPEKGSQILPSSSVQPEDLASYFRKENIKNKSVGINFGTGGIREVLGVRENQINPYTLGMALYALGESFSHKRGASSNKMKIVLGYDTRLASEHLALWGARVLLSFPFLEVAVLDRPIPTPILAFLVKNSSLFSGLMFTASHNPYLYHGCKWFCADGGQPIEKDTREIVNLMQEKDLSFSIPLNLEREYEVWSSDKMIQSYQEALWNIPIFQKPVFHSHPMAVAYTPLHGVGLSATQAMTRDLPIHWVSVPAELEPDPFFGNMPVPNPEHISIFASLEQKAKHSGCRYLLAHDPDADRVRLGYAKKDGSFSYLDGNEMGLLFFLYLYEHRVLQNPEGKFYIVGNMLNHPHVFEIAKKKGIATYLVPPGFKYIKAAIEYHPEEEFLFAFEESLGFLSHTLCLDKDGIGSLRLLLFILNWLEQKEGLEAFLTHLTQEQGYLFSRILYLEYSEKNNMSLEEASRRLVEVIEKEIAQICHPISYMHLPDFTKSLPVEDLRNEAGKIYSFYLGTDWKISIRKSGTESCWKIYTNYLGKIESLADIEKEYFMIESIVKSFL